MIRVTTFRMEGLDFDFKLASMNKREAKQFAEDSKVLLAKSDATTDEWDLFSLGVISRSLLMAGATNDQVQEILGWIDIPTLNALYLKVLEFSGLRRGEVKAAV